MKIKLKLLSVIFVLSTLFLFNPAQAVLIDLSGINVDGGAPTVLQVFEDENLDPDFYIGFWFTVEHFEISWPSETQITLTNSFWDIPYVLSGPDDCGFTSGAGQGAVECDAFINVGENSLASDGDYWTIELADTFDDGANPDYTFGPGSLIAWGDDLQAILDTKGTVPEPSIIALFALGLFGVGFARRRKA